MILNKYYFIEKELNFSSKYLKLKGNYRSIESNLWNCNENIQFGRLKGNFEKLLKQVLLSR